LPGVPLATQDCRMTGSVLPCRLWCSCAAIVVKDLHVHRNMQIIVASAPGFRNTNCGLSCNALVCCYLDGDEPRVRRLLEEVHLQFLSGTGEP